MCISYAAQCRSLSPILYLSMFIYRQFLPLSSFYFPVVNKPCTFPSLHFVARPSPSSLLSRTALSSGRFFLPIVSIIVLLPLFTFALLPRASLPERPPQSTRWRNCRLSFVTRTHCLSRPNKSCLYFTFISNRRVSLCSFMTRVVQLRPRRQECYVKFASRSI